MSSSKQEAGNNTELLQELEALSSTLYQSHTRRTASLALPRDNDVPASSAASRPRTRRLSLSPWRSRPNQQSQSQSQSQPQPQPAVTMVTAEGSSSKGGGGGWKKWKAVRALSHIGMQKVGCLLSVEVVAVHDLPPTMNGLRLSVCVRKKESRDGAVHTMPSRVSHCAADFEETLFLRCHLYSSSSSASGVKFEPRPFWVYAFAVDAPDLDFGRSPIDLARLVQDSVLRSQQGGERLRTWDVSFPLSGKATGAHLLLKLGFQIMDKDGALSIYNTSSSSTTNTSTKGLLSPSFARKQSKNSFSVPSPKLSNRNPNNSTAADDDEIDNFNLDDKPTQDDPAVPDAQQDLDQLPDFDVVDKGVEFQDANDDGSAAAKQEELNNKAAKQEEEEDEDEDESVKSSGEKSVVKEIDSVHVARLSELDAIAQQIKALESSMTLGGDDNEEADQSAKISKETRHQSQRLEADEESVTKEFLQMLEDEEFVLAGNNTDHFDVATELGNNKTSNEDDEEHAKTYLPDLGKNLGCVVQTRDGGYLASMNPFDAETGRKETPKLAMQVSKAFVLVPENGESGFEVLQSMGEKVMPGMEDVAGKTAEQIAFEGIAAAVINGRKRAEVASSSAGRAIASAKAAAAAMTWGRRERVATGIWNVREGAVGPGEVVAAAMPRMEAMAVEALRIQAGMGEAVDAPFEVSATANGAKREAVAMEEWEMGEGRKRVTVAVGIQVRDPLRGFEAVGGPMVGVIIAEEEEEEQGLRVKSVELGGVMKKKNKSAEKQRLTAMQWLVSAAKSKTNANTANGKHDVLWSLSSRVMADMWLTTIRNPDVKLAP